MELGHYALEQSAFSSSNDSFCFTALASAMAPIEVRPLCPRLNSGKITQKRTSNTLLRRGTPISHRSNVPHACTGSQGPNSYLLQHFQVLVHKALIATYFNIFKFWFTLRALASAVAPSELILFYGKEYSRVSPNRR